MAAIIQDTGEPAVYKPSTGDPRAILAHVDRSGARVDRSGARNFGLTPGAVAEVYVLNNPTTGITSAQLDRGRDQISIPDRFGGTPKPRTIGEILQENPAFMILELR